MDPKLPGRGSLQHPWPMVLPGVLSPAQPSLGFFAWFCLADGAKRRDASWQHREPILRSRSRPNIVVIWHAAAPHVIGFGELSPVTRRREGEASIIVSSFSPLTRRGLLVVHPCWFQYRTRALAKEKRKKETNSALDKTRKAVPSSSVNSRGQAQHHRHPLVLPLPFSFPVRTP